MNVYDFDKTIYWNDSSTDLVLSVYKKKPWLIFTYGVYALYGFLRYLIVRDGKERLKEYLFKVLEAVKDRRKYIEDFWDVNEESIKGMYLLRKKNDDLIISASPEFLVKPMCDRLGVRCIASPMDLDTLTFTGKNCHDEEKVVKFRELYPEARINEFYSDSYSDTPLAKLAEKAYLVKGEKLKKWKF